MIHIQKNGKRNFSQRMKGVCKVYVCMYVHHNEYVLQEGL